MDPPGNGQLLSYPYLGRSIISQQTRGKRRKLKPEKAPPRLQRFCLGGPGSHPPGSMRGFPPQESHPCFVSEEAALTTLSPRCGSPDGACPEELAPEPANQTPSILWRTPRSLRVRPFSQINGLFYRMRTGKPPMSPPAQNTPKTPQKPGRVQPSPVLRGAAGGTSDSSPSLGCWSRVRLPSPEAAAAK